MKIRLLILLTTLSFFTSCLSIDLKITFKDNGGEVDYTFYLSKELAGFMKYDEEDGAESLPLPLGREDFVLAAHRTEGVKLLFYNYDSKNETVTVRFSFKTDEDLANLIGGEVKREKNTDGNKIHITLSPEDSEYLSEKESKLISDAFSDETFSVTIVSPQKGEIYQNIQANEFISGSSSFELNTSW